MISHEPTKPEILIIESDNAVQYKYTQHFHEVQALCNRQERKILRVYGIAQHGKGEVDHVGGIAKNSIRKAVAEGRLFQDVPHMFDYLQQKFAASQHPQYHIESLEEEELDAARKRAKKYMYGTVDGSSAFQIVVFSPHSPVVKAALRICLCQACIEDYGSCELFEIMRFLLQR